MNPPSTYHYARPPARAHEPARPHAPVTQTRPGGVISLKQSLQQLPEPPMVARPPGTREDIDGTARLFRCLGDARRLKLLALLDGREMTLAELQAGVGSSYVNVSHHLELLHAAGLVGKRRRAGSNFYRLGDARIPAIVRLIFDFL